MVETICFTAIIITMLIVVAYIETHDKKDTK